MLVIETLAAPAPPSRRRRRPRQAEAGGPAATLPLARATAVRAFEPFGSEHDADRWLDAAVEVEDTIDALVADGIALLNRALHAHAAASADPHANELSPERAVAVRIGYGSGERGGGGSLRGGTRGRRPGGGRVAPATARPKTSIPRSGSAAVLGGRERIDACETLLLRARADLDAGRDREAALQLRVGLEALLVELPGAVSDPGHDEDMTTLHERRGEAGEAANSALRGELDAVAVKRVRENWSRSASGC